MNDAERGRRRSVVPEGRLTRVPQWYHRGLEGKLMNVSAEINYESLLSSAQRWTQRALLAYATSGRDDNDDSTLLFCAISWEHLCKAYLYSLDQALIFDTKRRSRSGQPLTISLMDAQSEIWRRKKLTRAIDGRRLEKLNTLAEIRNGILHAATLNVIDQRDLFVEYLRSSEELYCECLDGLVEPAARWGDFYPLITALIDEPCNLLREQVETKKLIAVWRRREIISTGTPPSDGDDYDLIVSGLIVERFNAFHWQFESPGDAMVHGYCPVCNEDDVAVYNGMITERNEGPALLRVSEFVCIFCELHFSTEKEMKLAGVSLTVGLDVDE